MHTDAGTEARRRLVVRGILITVVVYIEIVSFGKIIVGRTPASGAKYIGIPERYTTKFTSSTILLALTPFKIAKYSPVT
jgi:hypothetical protein